MAEPQLFWEDSDGTTLPLSQHDHITAEGGLAPLGIHDVSRCSSARGCFCQLIRMQGLCLETRGWSWTWLKMA